MATNPAVIDRPRRPLVPKAIRGLSCTAAEQQFAEHWIRYRNATQAYKHVHPGCSMGVARSSGHEWFKRPAVQTEIAKLLEKAREKSDAVADVGWLLRRYIDIATADPRELIGLKIGACRYCHGEGHGYQWREREYLDALAKAEREAARLPAFKACEIEYPDVAGGFGYNATLEPHPDCPQCHGEGVERFVPRDTDNLSDQALLLYGGVKVKRDGYEIVLADQQKALEMVGRILGAYSETVNHTGQIGQLLAVADLAKMNPQEASKRYQDFIAGRLSVNGPDKRLAHTRPTGEGYERDPDETD